MLGFLPSILITPWFLCKWGSTPVSLTQLHFFQPPPPQPNAIVLSRLFAVFPNATHHFPDFSLLLTFRILHFLDWPPSHWLLFDFSFHSHPLTGALPQDSSFPVIVHSLVLSLFSKSGKYTHSFSQGSFTEHLRCTRHCSIAGNKVNNVLIPVEDTANNNSNRISWFWSLIIFQQY